ncbi:hypothetical protein AK88_00626 [Plasmodium fragile]|uniref:Uncharacterized protein n=1 Tax=Plasmodium fragile TaxID=5857 RepID=A0A0D9QRX5_PLAFR|nr:uncharacterized protein AK88_00626 [Plasmodium fragile]KJP89668.1 hypothetical protein AK88_00626 [Plasmodium fragile]
MHKLTYMRVGAASSTGGGEALPCNRPKKSHIEMALIFVAANLIKVCLPYTARKFHRKGGRGNRWEPYILKGATKLAHRGRIFVQNMSLRCRHEGEGHEEQKTPHSPHSRLKSGDEKV